ncbi:hypothetical protein [Synechococcus phage BUCT-ZZ01]|nr:hypothetical protein [Synechococcus phage BUCT-ZZ01]
MAISKETLQNLLRNGIVEVKFTKVDGSTRVMRGTLSQTIIPEEFIPKAKPVEEGAVVEVKPEDPELVRLFDVDAQGWRSLKTPKILEVTVGG